MVTRTLEDAQRKTHWNNEHARFQAAHLVQYFADLESESRMKAWRCKFCFYLARGIAGQAFTKSACTACGVEMLFPTTSTDNLCEKCAKKMKLCKHCGAHMD